MPSFDFDFQGIFERISSFLQVAALVLGALFAAFWVAMIVWTFRDIRARSRDIFAQILAVLLVALIPVIGLFLYLLMRPKETLAEAYDRALEEEALLQSLEDRPNCPKCHTRAEKDFILCPVCYTSLKRPCGECGRLLALEWDVCPYCGHASQAVTPPEPAQPQPVAPPLPAQPQPLQSPSLVEVPDGAPAPVAAPNLTRPPGR